MTRAGAMGGGVQLRRGVRGGDALEGCIRGGCSGGSKAFAVCGYGLNHFRANVRGELRLRQFALHDDSVAAGFEGQHLRRLAVHPALRNLPEVLLCCRADRRLRRDGAAMSDRGDRVNLPLTRFEQRARVLLGDPGDRREQQGREGRKYGNRISHRSKSYHTSTATEAGHFLL